MDEFNVGTLELNAATELGHWVKYFLYNYITNLQRLLILLPFLGFSPGTVDVGVPWVQHYSI